MIDVCVDLSHWQASVDFAKVRAAGILAVINKCTQGTHSVDPKYAGRRDRAKAAGLLTGAYHFAVAGDAIAQADFLIRTAGEGELLALDFENNPNGGTMNVSDAVAFVERVNEKTGRYPLFYSGNTIKEALGSKVNETLQTCPLWIAQYSPTPHVQATWPTWTLHQYTDKGTVDGIAGHCDRNRFQGTEAGLRRLFGASELE